MRNLLILLLLSLASHGAIAQNINPEADEIYREDEVSVIRLVMTTAHKDSLFDEANIWSSDYLPAYFSFKNSIVNEALDSAVGIRLRGNTSRSKPKKSLKLKFKEFGGEKFYGQKKFNLKAEVNDPSFVRELTSLQTFRKSNIPAARTHYTEVYINDEYMGLYLNVEQLDDEFLVSRFDDDTGNLYKCSWGANLKNDGQIYDNEIYELKTNKKVNDRTILNNFVQVLNNTSSSEFKTAIEEVLNVPKFIKYLAVESLIGHWDGYSYNQNNYYLYENMTTGLIEFIPYDVDNTFGIDWVNRDWGTRDILDWSNRGSGRPLVEKILAQKQYFEAYRRELDSLLTKDFSETYFNELFDELKSISADAIERDTYFPLSFGYSFADFNNSFDHQVVGHAPYGVKEYVSTRASTAIDQVGVILSAESKLNSFRVYPNPSRGNTLNIISNRHIDHIVILNMMGGAEDFRSHQIGSQYQLLINLSSGVYLLQINEESKKFIVID